MTGAFLDPVMHEMRRLGHCADHRPLHFGLPDWLGDFQNPDWPSHFEDYARAFAERYPWVRYYTPVNEIYVTAPFSAAFGWWNEQLMTDSAFVNNVKHCVKAIDPGDAGDPGPAARTRSSSTANRPNTFIPARPTWSRRPFHERAALPLAGSALRPRRLGDDVPLPARQRHDRRGILLVHGAAPLRSHCIMGTDYYITNEHVLRADGRASAPATSTATTSSPGNTYDRYRLPVMHTETNRTAKHAVEWLWKEWMNLLRLREDGVPIVGFTWFGLIDMKDWDTALTKIRGTVNKVGLYTLGASSGKSREYRRLVEEYQPLPISSSKFPILTA